MPETRNLEPFTVEMFEAMTPEQQRRELDLAQEQHFETLDQEGADYS